MYSEGLKMTHIKCLLVFCSHFFIFTDASAQLSCSSFVPNKEITSKAISIVRNLESHFGSLFSTTGYKTMADFMDSLRRQPTENWVNQNIINGNLEVAVQVPQSLRDLILRNGVLNAYQIGGSFSVSTYIDQVSEYGGQTRTFIEGSYAGLSETRYRQLGHEVKIKSALIRPKKKTGVRPPETYFGQDFVILKGVEDRLTWTPGDSFDRANLALILPGQSHSSLLWFLLSPLEAKIFKRTIPKKWDQLFIPWKFRSLMAPLVAQSISNENVFGIYQKPRIPLSWGWAGNYIEGQIFGRIGIENIKAYEVTETPGSDTFQQTLRSLKIEYIDSTRSR